MTTDDHIKLEEVSQALSAANTGVKYLVLDSNWAVVARYNSHADACSCADQISGFVVEARDLWRFPQD
jgi:hypothetical protein